MHVPPQKFPEPEYIFFSSIDDMVKIKKNFSLSAVTLIEELMQEKPLQVLTKVFKSSIRENLFARNTSLRKLTVRFRSFL